MNDKFDELAKGLAQSLTRRNALKKFGLALSGMVLALFGPSKAQASNHCLSSAECEGICVRGHCRPVNYRNCNYCRGSWGCAYPDDTVCFQRCGNVCAPA